MLEAIVLFLLRRLGFRCRVCGDATVERDRFGNRRCVTCSIELEARLAQMNPKR